jgi:hypothetical protein
MFAFKPAEEKLELPRVTSDFAVLENDNLLSRFPDRPVIPSAGKDRDEKNEQKKFYDMQHRLHCERMGLPGNSIPAEEQKIDRITNSRLGSKKGQQGKQTCCPKNKHERANC